MRTFENPHPRAGWSNQPMQQPMQTQQPMQMTQEQAMQQALMQSMAANGFQYVQQNGQYFFYNPQTGAQVGYQQALMMLQQRAAQQQNNYGYPQQQSFYEPQVRQQPFNPTSQQFPAGSFQAANQRFDPSKGYTEAPADNARWGNTSAPTQPTPPQQPEKEVMTHATPIKQLFTAPICTEDDKVAFSYRPSKLVMMAESNEYTGASLYSLADQIRLEPRTSALAHPAVTVATVFHTDGYALPASVTSTELFTAMKGTDPRALYRTMRDYTSAKKPPSGLSGALFTSMLLNLDRDMTQAVNDFLKLQGSGKRVDSFCEDYNNLLKVLRDTTETVEDELNEYLRELLRSRLDVILTEGDQPVAESTVFATRETLVLVDLPITNFQPEYTAKGVLTVSKAVRAAIGELSKEIEANIFYISTLDKTILRVYRPFDATKEVIVEVMGFKD